MSKPGKGSGGWYINFSGQNSIFQIDPFENLKNYLFLEKYKFNSCNTQLPVHSRIVYLPTVQLFSGLSRFSTFKIAKNLDVHISEILFEKIRYWKSPQILFTVYFEKRTFSTVSAGTLILSMKLHFLDFESSQTSFASGPRHLFSPLPSDTLPLWPFTSSLLYFWFSNVGRYGIEAHNWPLGCIKQTMSHAQSLTPAWSESDKLF